MPEYLPEGIVWKSTYQAGNQERLIRWRVRNGVVQIRHAGRWSKLLAIV